MNAYEERREANIARNKRRLAELGLCDAVSKSEALFKKTRTPRASKVKGTAAVRKSARTAKPVQENLSEEHLAGGPESEGVALRISRKRFDTETMPKRKAVLHEFDDKHLFTDDNTLAFAQAWFGPLFKQPQLRSREDICEAMAYNLAEEYYTVDSLRNADAAKLDRVRKAAFSDIDAKGGWEDALNTVLSNLQQGMSILVTLSVSIGLHSVQMQDRDTKCYICLLMQGRLLRQTTLPTDAMETARPWRTTCFGNMSLTVWLATRTLTRMALLQVPAMPRRASVTSLQTLTAARWERIT